MPIDRGVIDGQLREIGEGDRWWEQREFRDLPHVLYPDERIHGIIKGTLRGPRRLRLLPARPRVLPARRWLMVATNQRLICLRRERFGRKQLDLRPGQITGMRHSNRIRACQITLDTPQGRYRIRIPKRDAFRFIGALAPLVPHPAVPPPNADPTALPWLPGMATVGAIPRLSALVSRVSLLASPDYATRGDLARVETTVERLESEVARLQQQVDFLEDLLDRRAEGALSLPAAPADS